MFWRNGNAARKLSDEAWPGLGTWFENSECCPECQPYLAEQQRTIAEARARAAEPDPEPADLPPGLGEWYRNSEECPECQPYLKEQAETIAKGIVRPTAPMRAIEKARARQEEMLDLLEAPIPDMGQFDWDTVEDHEMSTGGKIAWRLAIYGPLIVVPVILFLISPFPPGDTARHYAALAGCPFADMVGVAPARKGQPGYHGIWDDDDNGITCERSSRRRNSIAGTGGSNRFGNQ